MPTVNNIYFSGELLTDVQPMQFLMALMKISMDDKTFLPAILKNLKNVMRAFLISYIYRFSIYLSIILRPDLIVIPSVINYRYRFQNPLSPSISPLHMQLFPMQCPLQWLRFLRRLIMRCTLPQVTHSFRSFFGFGRKRFGYR